MKKKQHGQFFTVNNPFNLKSFTEWFDTIPIEKLKVIEPFAGSKNIPKMFSNKIKWDYYDIEPLESDIIYNDSLKNFPKGYDICITNPPYLSKNSATRSKIPYPDIPYDDIYKQALKLMIENCRYTVAIIPESFITSGLFLDKIVRVISINFTLFEDTECPVCVVIFDNKKNKIGFDFYLGEKKLTSYNSLLKNQLKSSQVIKMSNFYDPQGKLGLVAIDNTQEASIMFCKGEEIDSKLVKKTSRSITRISLQQDIELKIQKYGREKFIEKLNEELTRFRIKTYDLYLTSFKGLRKDSKYRRRISFDLAKKIVEKVLVVEKIITVQ